MPIFDATVRVGNQVKTVPIVASGIPEAMVTAKRQGVLLGTPVLRKGGARGGMNASERYVFLHQLATMSTAKVPMSHALQLLRLSHGGRVAAAAALLEAGVGAGRQLADLMVEDRKNFPGAVGLLVRAGAQGSGNIAESLKKAAEFERMILGAATKGANGLYSAAFWVVVATVSLFACPLWLTPYLLDSQLFKLTNDPISWPGLDLLAYVLGTVTLLLMVLGLGMFVLVGVGQRLFPEWSDKIVMRIPYLKDIVFTRDNFISLYRFSLMVKAGVTLEEALDTTWRDTRKGALKEDLRTALNNVRIGKSWSQDFRTVHPTDRAALAMAPDREELGGILEQVAEQNRAIYIRRLEILQPVMKIIAGVSMVLVYAVTGLYSIIPFSELFEKLMSGASGF